MKVHFGHIRTPVVITDCKMVANENFANQLETAESLQNVSDHSTNVCVIKSSQKCKSARRDWIQHSYKKWAD
jgi:hypothetical protein